MAFWDIATEQFLHVLGLQASKEIGISWSFEVRLNERKMYEL